MSNGERICRWYSASAAITSLWSFLKCASSVLEAGEPPPVWWLAERRELPPETMAFPRSSPSHSVAMSLIKRFPAYLITSLAIIGTIALIAAASIALAEDLKIAWINEEAPKVKIDNTVEVIVAATLTTATPFVYSQAVKARSSPLALPTTFLNSPINASVTPLVLDNSDSMPPSESFEIVLTIFSEFTDSRLESSELGSVPENSALIPADSMALFLLLSSLAVKRLLYSSNGLPSPSPAWTFWVASIKPETRFSFWMRLYVVSKVWTPMSASTIAQPIFTPVLA